MPQRKDRDVSLDSFDEFSAMYLSLTEAKEVPRQYRVAFDTALLHGWNPDDCMQYATARFFFELGYNKAKEEGKNG